VAERLRVTKKVAAILRVLQGGQGAWVSIHALTEATGEPRQNLAYSLERLTEDGLVERSDVLRPAHYRLTKPASVAERRRMASVLEAAEVQA
jgi:DNA-binding IclR family transcriptional regulator